MNRDNVNPAGAISIQLDVVELGRGCEKTKRIAGWCNDTARLRMRRTINGRSVSGK